jgi:Protein of unknown function (DUF2505)
MGKVIFELEQSFPAGLGRLWAALGRRHYVESKYLALGSTDLRILEFDVSERVINVVVERCVRTSGNAVPIWARPLFSGAHVLHHHTRWTRVDERSAAVELEIWPLRTPVRAHGDGAVVELSTQSTQMKLDIAVQCGVPAIGTQVAQLFAVQMKQALGQDHAFTLSYLGSPRSSHRRESNTSD